ncbi:MAG: DUF433 domain-containing protein [Betaproteobacteria bacterium]|nr:DUF433 domain-containing protein [Betaproteobacteria bacterium]
MIDWSTCAAVERDPERVSGVWVFRGTRVPVPALFENLEDVALVTQFVEWFPGVTLDQVRAVLDHAARSALAKDRKFNGASWRYSGHTVGVNPGFRAEGWCKDRENRPPSRRNHALGRRGGRSWPLWVAQGTNGP